MSLRIIFELIISVCWGNSVLSQTAAEDGPRLACEPFMCFAFNVQIARLSLRYCVQPRTEPRLVRAWLVICEEV